MFVIVWLFLDWKMLHGGKRNSKMWNPKFMVSRSPLVPIWNPFKKKIANQTNQQINRTIKIEFETHCPMLSIDNIQSGKQRDFYKEPVKIADVDERREHSFEECEISCIIYPLERVERLGLVKMDATVLKKTPMAPFNEHVGTDRLPTNPLGWSTLRSMESPSNYDFIDVSIAKSIFDISMTVNLASDVPVPYFSWVTYDFMKPPLPFEEKNQQILSTAFISNCDPQNFRMEAIKKFQNMTPPISVNFGSCFQNFENKPKTEILQKYKFHFSFENSNDEDYFTEKFFQTLQEGSIPVVIGPDNLAQFEPSPGSTLQIKTLADVQMVADRMRSLAQNKSAYEKMLQWKQQGPSNQFKALVDLAVVHSTCRLCIHVADRIRAIEASRNQPETCICHRPQMDISIFRFYIRERGRFEFLDAYLTLLDLKHFHESIWEAFDSLFQGDFRPIWADERNEQGRRSPNKERNIPKFEIYHVYKHGKNQRDALFGGGETNIDSDFKVEQLFSNPDCVKLEVIFL